MEAIFITDKTFEQLKEILILLNIEFSSEKDTFFFSFNQWFTTISRDESLPDDYEKEELDFIKSTILTPHFYSVDFNDFNLFHSILSKIGGNYLIDNDLGKFYLPEEFVLIKSRTLFFNTKLHKKRES